MCLLAVLFQVIDDAPVVLAANREEFYSRGGESPRLLDSLAAVGGVDPTHGGTWLGVNASGLVVAVTNRHKTRPPQSPRSRGLLVRSLLRYGSVEEAESWTRQSLDPDQYDGCNLLLIDARRCLVLHLGDNPETRSLPPGIHVLSNRDVNDPGDQRVTFVAEWLNARSPTTQAESLATLQELCALPEVCFRFADRGTVSSSLLALPRRWEDGVYLHAQGSPNLTPHLDVSHLLRALRDRAASTTTA